MLVYLRAASVEPYRIFFPLGIFYLLYGILLWLPQIWNSGDYPVTLHRYLMVNGFTASFIGGFLMTAVPKFSKTGPARGAEVFTYFFITLFGMFIAHTNRNEWTLYFSASQALVILFFLFSRIFKRKENPPYSFVFIFVGLFLWLFSAIASILLDQESFKFIYYEGALAAIILGVGSRLIPDILGHVEVVSAQRALYEPPKPILATVPWHFYFLIMAFVGSYFLNYPVVELGRAFVVLIISVGYFKLHKLPKVKTALTYSVWIASWPILLSFLLRGVWYEGGIHAAHSFFINGIVLMSLLIATRVLQSHGPNDKELENWKGLYVVTGIIMFAAATRVTAYLMPHSYLSHLGYSSLLLTFAVCIWAIKYIKFSATYPKSY